MITAELGKLGGEFSHYLDFVRNGEDILIAESGKIIARIAKEKAQDAFISHALRPLISKGLVICPTRPLDRDISVPAEIPGKPISEMVTEDRR